MIGVAQMRGAVIANMIAATTSRFVMRAPGLDLLDNGLESFVTNNRLRAHGRES